jgi:hypothetical protein
VPFSAGSPAIVVVVLLIAGLSLSFTRFVRQSP